MSDLEFAEPPPVKRGVEPLRLTPAQEKRLHETPGEWARMARNRGNSLAGKLRLRHPGYEFTVRKAKAGKGVDIYVRWPA